ncbi:MAG: DUF6493 family protein [Planctomycetota bacterium]
MSIKKAVLSNKPQNVVRVFEGMPEKDRKAIAKELLAWLERVHRDCTAGARVQGQLREDLRELDFDMDKLDESYRYGFSPVARVALFATQPMGELATHDWTYDDGEACIEAAFAILAERAPHWIDDLVSKWLDNNSRTPGVVDGALILAGVERDLFKQPEGQAYLECVAGMADEDFKESKGIKRDIATLESNDSFLDRDVFHLTTFTNTIFHGHSKSAYRSLLKRLFVKKKIDRTKFLESLLSGLLLDHKKNQLQGMTRFFEELKLAEEESKQMAVEYGRLLASPHSFVASMALKRLQDLVDSRTIAFTDCVNTLNPAFENPAKGNANKILTWINKQTKADGSIIPRAVEPVLSALGHPEVDVQKKAVKLLSTWKKRLHRDHAAMMRDVASSVSATVRKSLLELTDEIGDLPQVLTKSATDTSPEVDDTPAPQPCRRLVPIATHEELIDRVSAALEVTESGIEAEQILEAISRLGPVPAALESRAAPISKRAAEECGWSMVPGCRGLADAPDAKPRMWRVIAIAMGMKELVHLEHDFDEDEAADFGMSYPPQMVPIPLPDYEADGEYSERSPGYAYRSINYAWHSRILWQRLEPLERRLLEGTLLPLLASPTHDRGWIEPSALIDRLRQWQSANVTIDTCDMALALMRLRTEGRTAALKSAKDLGADVKWVLAVALDGKLPKGTPPEIGTTLLQVAARVRTVPLSKAEEERIGIDADYASGELPKLQWRMNQKIEKLKQTHDLVMQADWNSPPWMSEDPVLSELHRYKHVHLHSASSWRLEMDAWNDPYHREAYFAGAMRRLVDRVENGSSNSAPYHAYFEALFDDQFQWSLTACGAVVLALLGKDNDVLAVATDAMNEAIPATRVTPEIMTDAMVRVFIAPWPRAARFAENLARVAEAGPKQQQFVAQCLAGLIQAWCEPTEFKRVQTKRLEKPADCLKLIELLNECVADSEFEVPPSLLQSISKVKAKGKIASALAAMA